MAEINLVQFYNAIAQGAREATLQVLESALADPATSAKQDVIKGVLDTLATESTLGDVKTAAEALAALISNSRLKTEAQLTGSIVEIDGDTFRLLPDGNTLVGPADDRPEAGDAVSAIGRGVVYLADDTGELAMSDGTNWNSLGRLF